MTLVALLVLSAPAAVEAQESGTPDAGVEDSDVGAVAEETAMATAPCPSGSDAGEAASEPPRFESVVTADPYDPSGTSDRLLRRGDLDRQGARSVAEALERSPAVYATTGGRNERIFTIRGFDQRQTAVLVDGAPALIAYDGQVDLGMMPAELVDHVTLSRGPGTLAVGPSGLGPTVSIVSRRAGDGPLVLGRLEGGWPGTWRGTAMHSQRFERGGYTVYAGGEQSQGFSLSNSFKGTPLQPQGDRINSDRQAWFAGGSAVVTPAEKHELALSASYVDGDKGVPPSTLDDTPRYWRFNVWRGLAASLGHAYRGAVQVEESSPTSGSTTTSSTATTTPPSRPRTRCAPSTPGTTTARPA
ncbi:MAG: TonB-dependent receptor plug domain-containing protein [Myxococcales bacterium]